MCMTTAPGTLQGWESPAGIEHAALHMRSLGVSFLRHREGPGAWHACICHLQGLLHEESINCAHATQSLRLLKF